MQPEFWQALWHENRIAFHRATPAHLLVRHWSALALPKDAAVFAPLCGKSVDLVWLRERGHPVVGVELSSIAVQSFCLENGIPARRRLEPPFERYEASGIALLCGDFFDLTRPHVGPVAAVYDRASLIAWDPAARPRYVEHMTALTTPGTRTLLITLEYAQAERAGPPFAVLADEVRRLYAGHHRIDELSRDDVLSAEPRMRARGVSRLHEVAYCLTRL